MNGGALSGGVAMSSGGQGQMQGRATPDVQQIGIVSEGFPGNTSSQGQHGQIPMGGEFGMQVSVIKSAFPVRRRFFVYSLIFPRRWDNRCIRVRREAAQEPLCREVPLREAGRPVISEGEGCHRT